MGGSGATGHTIGEGGATGADGVPRSPVEESVGRSIESILGRIHPAFGAPKPVVPAVSALLAFDGMKAPLVEIKSVVKRFASVEAVAGVSFTVQEGEIFALLGPNGAGKTTLVRMLVGITRPDSGTIAFGDSLSSGHGPYRGRMGYLPEERGLYLDRPTIQTLAYLGALRGLSRSRAEASARAWLDRLGLADRATHKIETLSKGNQQRVQIVAAILHKPALAILDEPFSGLDPINQDAVVDLIRELRSEGMTVLLSAHQMDLVERLADRVLLMNRGQELVAGTVPELRARYQGAPSIRLDVVGEINLDALRAHPAIADARIEEDGAVTVVSREGEDLTAAVAHAASVVSLRGIHSERPRLHDIYVRAVREHERRMETRSVS